MLLHNTTVRLPPQRAQPPALPTKASSPPCSMSSGKMAVTNAVAGAQHNGFFVSTESFESIGGGNGRVRVQL